MAEIRQVKECSYLGRNNRQRLICAGKYLNDGKIVFIDRKNSVLLLTDPTTEYTTERDLVPLLPNLHYNADDRPRPSDVNKGFDDDQLLITFTGTDFSLGIVCRFTINAEEFVLQPVPDRHVRVNQRTRSIIVLDNQHFCASTEYTMQVLRGGHGVLRDADVVDSQPRQTRDRGGLLMTDGNGHFYYGDGNNFCCCLWNGNRLTKKFDITHERMKFRRGSAISGDGNILVCCDSAQKIFRLSPNGENLGILHGAEARRYGDIDVHPDGITFFTTFWGENEWPLLYQL